MRCELENIRSPAEINFDDGFVGRTAKIRVALNDQETPITITMARDGEMFVGQDATTLETLVPQLMEQTDGETGRLIKIEGDQNLLYGNVTETMSVLYQAGFDRVRLIMERPSDAR